MSAKLGAALMVGGATLLGVQSSLLILKPGEAAIKYDMWRGVLPYVYSEGLNFNVPFVQRPTKYEIRSRPREFVVKTQSKDQQQVFMKFRVLQHPIPECLPWIHNKYSEDFEERILPSLGQEIVKWIIAQFNAEELITERDRVSAQIREAMSTRATINYGLRLDDIAIMDLQFSKEYAEAVENKQIEQQEAERRGHIVQMHTAEKQRKILLAEGDAIAAEKVGDALSKAGPGLVELRRMEACKAIAEKCANSNNISFIPSNGSVLLATGGNLPVSMPVNAAQQVQGRRPASPTPGH